MLELSFGAQINKHIAYIKASANSNSARLLNTCNSLLIDNMHVYQACCTDVQLVGQVPPAQGSFSGANVYTPDVSIFVLVPHVLILLLPVNQQGLHLVHNASDTIGDLHNASHGGVFIGRDDVIEAGQGCRLWLTAGLHCT